MPDTVYIETTIPSYLAARRSRNALVAAHQEVTRQWWNASRHRYAPFISQFVLDEAARGDSRAARRRLAVIQDIPQLDLTGAVERLAGRYVRLLGISDRYMVDAFHLAFAVEYEMDFLLTWNCAHMANGEVRLRLQQFNVEKGLHLPIILTPEELIPEEEK